MSNERKQPGTPEREPDRKRLEGMIEDLEPAAQDLEQVVGGDGKKPPSQPMTYMEYKFSDALITSDPVPPQK